MFRTNLKDIEALFKSFKLPSEPIVLIHSCLFKFGIIEGGAQGLLNCIRTALGPEATLVMPAFTFSFPETKLWHSNNTPSEAGAFTEFFRRAEGTRRTLHPFHSLSVIGKYQTALLERRALSSFGPGSAYELLCDMDAINISLGADFEGGTTYLHHSEEMLHVPYRFYKEFPGDVYDHQGNRVDSSFKMFVRIITKDYEYRNTWDRVWDYLDQNGCFKTARISGANVQVSNMNFTHSMFRKALLKDPFFAAEVRKL